MWKHLCCAAACVVMFAASRELLAHGTPIVVAASGSELTASGGGADSEGYAPQIFVEDDEEGDPSGSVTLPNVGPVILWQVPGFNISGLNNSASLSIEVLARPVKDSTPLEHRVVWYWNPSLEEVAPSLADIHLLGTGARFTTLPSNDSVAPPPFELAATLTGQQNFHNHVLLSYGLDNDSPRPVGAYGFFARLTSNQYGASNPFLVVFNYGVDYELMVEAALAINAAAADSESLPGDYNHDGTVDAADYVMWRKPLPTDNGYLTWQNNFGRTLNGGGGSEPLANSPVPEPSTILLTAYALSFVVIERSSRKLR
jgi:hypothetical protein